MNPLSKYGLFILYVIAIFIYIHTYIYLNKLDNCECFNSNSKYAVDIEFMKFFQILEIFIISIYFFFMFFIKTTKKKLFNSLIVKLLSNISIVLLLGICIYMSYNVLNLYINIKEDCKCSDGFYKYFIYYEGITTLTTVMRIISLFVTLIIMFIFNKLN
jgi:hypothetical protein